MHKLFHPKMSFFEKCRAPQRISRHMHVCVTCMWALKRNNTERERERDRNAEKEAIRELREEDGKAKRNEILFVSFCDSVTRLAVNLNQGMNFSFWSTSWIRVPLLSLIKHNDFSIVDENFSRFQRSTFQFSNETKKFRFDCPLDVMSLDFNPNHYFITYVQCLSIARK